MWNISFRSTLPKPVSFGPYRTAQVTDCIVLEYNSNAIALFVFSAASASLKYLFASFIFSA